MITVHATGPLALLQDLGRPGLAHLGVSPSGAADRSAHTLANRLVGNPERVATIEVVLGGLVVSSTTVVWVAVTGAATELSVAARSDRPRASPSHASLVLRPGEQLTIHPPRRGLRNYLAVRGGFTEAETLGSRSHDMLSGLGPEPLAPGQQLTVGRPRRPLPDTDVVAPTAPRVALDLSPGPRQDWFTRAAWSDLLGSAWTVTAEADRVAVRLAGPALARRDRAELASEALVRGAIQVPAVGQPLVFLADHPVTGGYPVIAVLTDRACDDAAQLRPGDEVRFAAAHRVSGRVADR